MLKKNINNCPEEQKEIGAALKKNKFKINKYCL